jgi:hypothetical protein
MSGSFAEFAAAAILTETLKARRRALLGLLRLLDTEMSKPACKLGK